MSLSDFPGISGTDNVIERTVEDLQVRSKSEKGWICHRFLKWKNFQETEWTGNKKTVGILCKVWQKNFDCIIKGVIFLFKEVACRR